MHLHVYLNTSNICTSAGQSLIVRTSFTTDERDKHT